MVKFLALGLMLIAGAAHALPIIPGMVGYGSESVGGRGGTIYRVTNLNDNGTGSLEACTGASGPRVCLFEVSGTINDDQIIIRDPYLTIDGASAPSPGIQITGRISILAHNVFIRHIAVRGKSSGTDNVEIVRGGGGTGNVNNVVLDHMSMSYTTDGMLDTYLTNWDSGADYNTIGHLRFNKLLIYRGQFDAQPLMVNLNEGTGPITMTGSVIAHGSVRFPAIKDDTELINNIFYNWNYRATEISRVTEANIINNLYRAGAQSNGYAIECRSSSSNIYYNGNQIEGAPGEPKTGNVDVSVCGVASTTTPQLTETGYNTLSVSDMYTDIMQDVGSRPTERASIDQTVLNEIDTTTGSWNTTAVYPTYANNYRSLESAGFPANPHLDSDSDGYTNLEEWLQGLADALENPIDGGTDPPDPPPDPDPTEQIVVRLYIDSDDDWGYAYFTYNDDCTLEAGQGLTTYRPDGRFNVLNDKHLLVSDCSSIELQTDLMLSDAEVCYSVSGGECTPPTWTGTGTCTGAYCN